MKIAVVGDTHFGAIFALGEDKDSGGNTRIDDYENTFNFIIDYCIENDVKILIQTGDLFEHRKPDGASLMAADRCLRRLSSAGIRTYVIMGNHDYIRYPGGHQSYLEAIPANNYDKVSIYIKPQAPKVNINGEDVNLVLLPFQDKKSYFTKDDEGNVKPATTEQASKKVEQIITNMLDELDTEKPTIFVGHNFFYEGSYNKFGGGEILVRPEIFEDKCNAAMMGHLHQFRVVKKYNPTIIYTGSLERTNFGESSQTKYLSVYDSVLDKCEFVELPCKTLSDITIDLSSADAENFYANFKEEISKVDYDNHIVRFKVKLKETLRGIISEDKIKNSIVSGNPCYISKIILEPVKEKIKRNLEIMEEESDFKIFKKFVNDQTSVDEDLRKMIVSASKEILEE